MKIFEIVQEAPTVMKVLLDAGPIPLYKGKLGDFIVDVYNKPKSKQLSDAIDLGTAEYSKNGYPSKKEKILHRNKKELEKERLKRKAGDQEKGPVEVSTLSTEMVRIERRQSKTLKMHYQQRHRSRSQTTPIGSTMGSLGKRIAQNPKDSSRRTGSRNSIPHSKRWL